MEPPVLEIVSLIVEGVGEELIVWDEDGHARIILPRDKVPETADDLSITVPEGVYVHAITKRER